MFQMIGTSNKDTSSSNSSNGLTSQQQHMTASTASVASSAPAVGSSKYVIAEESINILKTLGAGEFGTVQQGVWTTEDGARVQVRGKLAKLLVSSVK